MLICPLNSKINELTVSLGNYYDAMQVYLLSEGKYPSKEDALKIRNRFKNTPFYSSIAHYEDNLSIYRNFTTDGVVQGLDKAELAEVEKIFKNRGFKITVPLHTVQGSRRIKDTESWMFIVDTPMYQAAEVSREEFLQDNALLEQYQAEDKIAFNKTDNTKALEKKLIDGFLADFGITTTEYNDLKEDLGLDAYSASDLITKAIAYQKGQSILPEVAYFAYSMLGAQNNKIRSELRYLINKWDKYQERFDYHSKAVKEKEGFIEKEKWKNKIRDLVIIDFLQEKLQEYYKNPTSFTKTLDTKWTKEDFTLWTKIMKAIESFLSNFSSKYKNSSQKLSELGVSIADEILNNNYEYFDYKLEEDQIKKYYNETISSDPFAKSLVEFGQQKLGLVLTGSLALRKAGEVYRTVKETLHDIDWVVPYDLNKVDGKPIEPLIEAFTGALPKNLDSVDNYLEKLEWYKEFKAKYPSFKLTNGFYGKEHNNYESVTIQGVVNGEFYDSSGTHEETKSYYTKDPITKKPVESKKTVIVEHERGDWIKGTGYAIDFFVRLQPHQEEHENYFKLWKEIMIAKIKMGRPKDFTDWKSFVPFTKSKDSFNFNFEGYRHINWSENNQKNSLEESTKQTIAKTPVIDKQAKAVVVKMLDKLAKRFNVPYEIITAAKAKKLYDNYGGEKAFYYKGKVYLLEDGITLENALHEFSHPFIRAIAQKNVDLFTNIVEEILSTPEGRAIYNQVKELYPEHVVDGELNYAGFEEVAVRALTAEAEKQYTTPEFESAVQRLLKAIKNLLRGLFSTNAVDTIDANTSLKELAGILLGDKAYDLGLQDDAIAFNKSIKYEIYNGLPFTEESLARMSDGEKRITVRTKVHPTGIYEYNGQRFKILNLGQKNIKDFKTPERVKRKFREEYKKGMFKHIDNFFDGKTNLFVYQIEKIDNSIVNEYVKEEPLDEDLVFTNATTNATVKAIKDWLVSKKDSALKHKSDTGLLSKLKKVEDIEEQLKQLSLAEIMGSIVNDVYSALADPNNPNSYLLQFKKIIQEVASAETREDAEKVVEKIGAYKEYVAGLKIIDDLLNYQLAEENPNEGSTLAKLNGIKNALFELDKKIKDTAPYVLAIANKGSINEELRKNIEAYWPMIKKLESDIRELEAKGEKIKAAALKSKKEDLERKLGFPLLGDLTQIYLEGGNDINFFERMVKTVANTTDAAIGLFYKRYKEEIDKGRKKINELTKATYYKYKQFTEGKSIDNFEQLYEKMTENVDILRFNEDSGQYETFTEKWFISDFDQNAYNLKRKQAYDLATLEEKKARDAAANGDNEGYKEGMATARRIRANFRRNNTIAQDKLESRDKVIEILLQKEKLFDNSAEGKSQFYAWVTNHLYNEELYIEYVSQEDPTKIAEYGKKLLDSYIQNKGTKVSGMFLVPDKTKFPNAKYNALTTEDRKYYDHLLSVYKESQKLLPEFERPGLRVPSVEKDIKDILIEQKDVKKSAVAAWERNFKNHIEDASKGIVYKGQTKRIPVYFNQSMAADTVSMNLTDTVMKFAEMAEQFKINSSLESLALLTKETIAERIVEKKTSTGKKILSALHKKMYGEEVVEPIKFAETEAYKMFESWLDSNFYNERRYAANLGTVRLDKVVDTMMAANALSVLGADGLKALSNRLTAGVNIAIESLGNKYFTAKTLVKGKAKVGQLMYATAGEENLLMDTLRGVKTTHFGQMLDIFQAIQGENDAVEEIGGSMVKRNASTSLLMGGLSAGEFIAQANMFAAIAYDIKIKTKSGEEISLLDAYIKEADGIVRLRKDVEFTLEDEQLLRNKINAINKELHGVYNKIDEVEAKKNWVGRALIQFRNFLVPNVERRFQELHVNFEMNDIVEGYYKTLYRKMVTERNFKIWQIYNDPSLTENERNNLKKAVVELTSYFVLAAIVSILGSMGDDDDELKDNYAYNVALYSALRLKGEIGFFIPGINLKEGYRIIKSPSAINTLLERSVKFGGQLFTDPFGEYERNSGPWEKGDSKLKAKFLKLFFGYNGSNLDPSIAVENFKGLSN